jgi:hypothetical protein
MPKPPDDQPAETPTAPNDFSLNFRLGFGKQPPNTLPPVDFERRGPKGPGLTATDVAGDPVPVAVPGTTHKFEWTVGGNEAERDPAPEPATYYEALTGRPDPMRGFFVTTHRILNIVTWIIALGIPVGLVTLGVVLGESTETIVIMGIAGLIVGMMFKVSFPKTPFG